ncbi:MAG TPA: M20 family metallopeptidase [Acidimicrobiales bacterium]|nr:M20 family metallopeptidase [Acidimicrobiales bacterium]
MEEAFGPKAAARRTVEARAEELVGLSHAIHARPELGFEEHYASELLTSWLDSAGLEVETGVAGLATAFCARAGSGPLTIAICAEYDALPGIGHACGHNVIAAAAAGAGAALAPLADELGLTVKVMGTPAEEGGGGKIIMLERGAFSGVHAAMMVHPAPVEMPHMRCLAVSHFDVHYRGRAAHASAFPEEGVNAADALTVAQVAIGLLRQHLGPSDQVHGIVTRGGEAPNIVPERTSAKYYVRAETTEALEALEARIRRCFEAGALATGSQMEIVPQSPVYSHFEPDREMGAAFQRNAEALGRRYPPLPRRTMGGSTDMANLSLVMPAIHPMLGIESLPAVNHQPEFAAAAVRPPADKAVLDGAAAMAWTAIDLATDPGQRRRLLGEAA